MVRAGPQIIRFFLPVLIFPASLSGKLLWVYLPFLLCW
jgi:hypothetical protein